MPYLGRGSDFGVRSVFHFLATNGQTSVSGSDADSKALSFTDGNYIDVYLNGVRLKSGEDYNTSTANTVAGLTAMNANDEVNIIVYDAFSVADTVPASSGGTFNGGVTHSGAVTLTGGITGDLDLNTDSATIKFGADDEIQLTHHADTGLKLKHTATGDDKPVKLTLQTGETDIAANDVLGAIDFQAPDEGTGTDAILVAAGIQAVSEGDFAADNNATALALKTGASETATEKLRVSSAGRLGLGTSSPDYLVDIEGAVADDAVTALLRISADDPASSGDHAEMRFSLGNGATDTGIRRGHIDVLSNNGTDARNLILNPSGGNIGVGTTTPSTMLDIVSPTKVRSAIRGTDSTTDNASKTFGVLNAMT